ncbi:hypothetical protein ACFVVX_10155 [Kitasatospora sp. NPDC058170]|uniref:hypothetical protein n=1 Tax=Kitasatospora sp. NPDC058170 TaxID=3346364 RepID=UPI0036DDEB4B
MQRDTGSTGGAVRTTPAPASAPAPASGTTPGTASATAPRATASGRPGGSPREAVPQGGDLDLDDLARRLLDPVARLLRTELRRGRERAGRPFDGRR